MADYIADVMSKKIDGKYLVTTISGAWDVLTPEEYNLTVTGKAERNPELYKRLVEEGIITTKDNLELISTRIRQRYSFLCESITLYIVAITNRCTHQCIYCHAEPATGEKRVVPDMSRETAEKIADFILSAPAKTFSVEFQGGEPLLNIDAVKHLINRIESAKGEKRPIYRMATNLSEMTDKTFDELTKLGLRFATSLDGPRELHNKNRPMGHRGNYDKVIRWINYARERFNMSIGPIVTITRYSFKHGVKSIIDEYVKHKVYHIRLRELNLSGAAIPHWGKIGYTADEFFDLWKEGLDYCIALYEQGIPIKEDMTKIILHRLLNPTGGQYMCYRSPCGAGTNQVSYDPAGDVYFCDAARSAGKEFIIGNVNKMSYPEMVERTKGLRKLCNITTPCRQCVWSPYCGTCLLQPYGKGQGFITIKPRDFHCQLRQKQIEYIVNLLMGKHKDTLLEWWTVVDNSR